MAPRFLKIYFTIVGLGMVAVAALNWAVDPYASFRWADITGFNDQKRLKLNNSRVNKAVILDRFAFDTVFLGTSTAETGLDPNSPMLNGSRAFNAALPFADMVQIHGVASYVAQHQRPRRVIIGLDFLVFSDRWGAGADYDDSPFAGKPLLPIYAQRLLSWPTLIDSIGVASASFRGKRSPLGKHGAYDPSAAKAPDHIRERFTHSLEAYLAFRGYSDYHYMPRYVDMLQEAITRLRATGTEVTLFITPVHAVHLDLLETIGLAPQYQAWKEDLIRVVAALNQSKDAPVHLWDFSGVNSITSEAVPTEPGSRMDGYWDAAHYNAAIGNLILCRMLGCPTPVPDDFGIDLTIGPLPPITKTGALAAFSPALADKAKVLRVNH